MVTLCEMIVWKIWIYVIIEVYSMCEELISKLVDGGKNLFSSSAEKDEIYI